MSSFSMRRARRMDAHDKATSRFSRFCKFPSFFLSPTSFYLTRLGVEIIIHVITHNDTPQSAGLLWTSDQPVAETST